MIETKMPDPVAWRNWSALTGNPRLGFECEGGARIGLYDSRGTNMTIDPEDFDLPDDLEEKLRQKHDELIDNQPEHEPNDGCEGGACVI